MFPVHRQNKITNSLTEIRIWKLNIKLLEWLDLYVLYLFLSLS